jgi:hypothetical protein
VLSPVRDHILQEFKLTLCISQDSDKIATPPKQKSRRGGGLRQINTCGKVPLQVNFLDDDILNCFLSV